MLQLSDVLPARRFTVVTVALFAANLAVWIRYELPDLKGAIAQASFVFGWVIARVPLEVERIRGEPAPRRSAVTAI